MILLLCSCKGVAKLPDLCGDPAETAAGNAGLGALQFSSLPDLYSDQWPLLMTAWFVSASLWSDVCLRGCVCVMVDLLMRFPLVYVGHLICWF